jgi:chromosome partitioning protein
VTDRASASLAPPRSSPSGSSKKPAAQGKTQAPEPAVSTRVIAIANQKGGVGKSTTAVSLGAALADNGHRVLVIDLDPQGNASTGMGIRHEAREVTVYDVLASDAPLEAAVVRTAVEGLSAIPSTIDLAGAEIELVSQFSRETKLKKAIEPVSVENVYDFIILDCPPSLGLLTVNALTAAKELIVPIQCEYYALEGLGQLLRNVSLVQQNINPELRLSGIVMTMFDPRTKLSEQVVQEVQRYFGDLMYDVIIPRTVRLSEAPGFGQPITEYDPKSKGAESYRRLAVEVASRPRPEGPMPVFKDLPTVVVNPPDAGNAAGREAVEAEDAEDVEAPLPSARQLRPEQAPAASPPKAPVAPEGGTGAAATPAAAKTAIAARAPTAASDRSSDAAAAARPVRRAPGREPRPSVEAELDEDLWEPPAPEASRPSTKQASKPRPEARPSAASPSTAPPSPPPPVDRSSPSSAPEQLVPVEAGAAPRVVVIDEDDADYVRPGEPGGSRSTPEPPPPAIGATLEDDEKKPRRWRLFRKGGE